VGLEHGIGFRGFQVLGRGAALQRPQPSVLIHRHHHGGLSAQVDDVMLVGELGGLCAHTSIVGRRTTKTSFAMFLLHSITNCGVLAGEAHNTKVLVFSVKGEDLLFLDYANSRLTAAQRELYARLGLPAAPFGNVRVFAPPRRDDPAGTPDVSARDRAVSPFYWTLAEFCGDELLPFVFADAEDERAQYTMLIGQVAATVGGRAVLDVLNDDRML
jgi:hypothetical protein